mmetsp:Transcript_5556/g.5739  ORF Transcript_5556/g.5739 Transcript_5556/m.5739 type:complete len:232 (+) Transcript_5556:92-787(+)|eukprot:CAMPEP_0182427776 /NCGR_PEP_ID=MMETSP1167-20130531/19459_1 /TAXON_ID=2988 /ORGANISM="Mallomonas Sp, Strain CCMP3275" /LENGTH=231 /DNA_ID=CAMNT_0024610249 /DNA_START=88 /DNA_END=783 /DNA_ORIENTATION=-
MFRKAGHLFGRALRETGQALDRLGLTVSGNEIFKETFSRHRSIMNLYDKRPVIAVDAFIAPSASVIGSVLLYDRTSIWYGAVLRGDVNKIRVGPVSNVQDRAVIYCTDKLDSGFSSEVDIGSHVTVGHGAVLHSCTVRDECVIGMGAVISEGSIVDKGSMVAAGAIVLADTFIPSGQLWAGNPAKFVRNLTEEELASIPKSAEAYADLAAKHSEEFLPYGTVYQHSEKLNA